MATGNGRRTAGGVDGTRCISGEDNAESEEDEVVELCVCDVAISEMGFGMVGGSAGLVGKDARGDGGGKTKEVGRSELARGANDFAAWKDSAANGGTSSVSYESITLEGEARERFDER